MLMSRMGKASQPSTLQSVSNQDLQMIRLLLLVDHCNPNIKDNLPPFPTVAIDSSDSGVDSGVDSSFGADDSQAGVGAGDSGDSGVGALPIPSPNWSQKKNHEAVFNLFFIPGDGQGSRL